MTRARTDLRAFLIAGSLTFVGIAIVGRLFFVQVVSHSYYAAIAERQHAASVDTDSRRGNIYFSDIDGTLVPAAALKRGFLLYIDPRKITDASSTYDSLEPFLTISRDEFLKRVGRPDDPYEAVAHRLDDAAVEQIKLLGEAGVGVAPEEWRVYPGGTEASHILGFVGSDGARDVGRYGVERAQETALESGVLPSGGLSAALLNFGKKIFRSPTNGADIVLTINSDVQFFVEKKLDELSRWHGEKSGIIVMDPATGKILAMAARPNFDPNKYNEAPSLDVFTNPLVEGVYELGSVFKPLTMAAAIDLGKLTSDTQYTDYGYVQVGDARIENYDGKGRGRITMQDVLDESLNTGAVFAEQQIGAIALRDYFEAFGLADKTDIGLPDEVRGKLENLDSGNSVNAATASFGQGIAVTPLAFLRAVSILANGGSFVKPYVVDRISVEGAPDVVTAPEVHPGIIKKKTADTMTQMLVRVVDDALLGGELKNPRYSIAAKTGTAQIADPKTGGYSADYLHSLFGYGPASDARFAVFLFITKPQGERYASHTLAKPFMDIMNFLLSYYRVPPDR